MRYSKVPVYLPVYLLSNTLASAVVGQVGQVPYQYLADIRHFN